MMIEALHDIALKLDRYFDRSEAQEVAIQSLTEAVASVQAQLSRSPPRIRQQAPLTELTTAVKSLDGALAGFRASLALPLPTPQISAPADLLSRDLERIRLAVREELGEFSRKLDDHDRLRPRAPHFSPEQATDMVAVAVSRTGQPVRIVDAPVIKSLVQVVAPQFHLPNSAELRKAIIDIAKRWHQGFNYQTHGEYVSLMIDGASMASRRWLGVCIATADGFWFWRMLELPGTSGEQIAHAIQTVVVELRNK
jgi:hypothetical protein